MTTTTILRDSFTHPDEQAAYDLAAYAHTGQTRRGTQVPYLVHPVAVALKLREFGITEHAVIAASLLHDTVEDTRDPDRKRYHVSLLGIHQRFGERIGLLVQQLTTPVPKVATKRAEWDQAEIVRLGAIEADAKSIKLADIYCNIDQVMAQDPEFACPYLLRKEMQMPALVGGNAKLWVQTYRLIQSKKWWMYRQTAETVEATVTPAIDVPTEVPPP